MRTELVTDALQMALAHRRPDRGLICTQIRAASSCRLAYLVLGRDRGQALDVGRRPVGGRQGQLSGRLPGPGHERVEASGAFTSRSRTGPAELTCSVYGTFIGVLTHSPAIRGAVRVGPA